MVPASRAAYGYRYCRDAEIAPDGKVLIKRAWWEVNELGPMVNHFGEALPGWWFKPLTGLVRRGEASTG